MPKISQVAIANRRQLKMEKIARLELANYTDMEIGMCLGITEQYVRQLRRTPEFVAIRVSLASGILKSLTNNMEEDIKATQDQLKQMVPDAVLTLRNVLYDGSNKRLQFEAAKEIMDREGTLAKVSKSEIKKTNIFDFDANIVVENDLLSALQNNTKESVAEMLLEQEKFAQSGTAEEHSQEEYQQILTLQELPTASDAIN